MSRSITAALVLLLVLTAPRPAWAQSADSSVHDAALWFAYAERAAASSVLQGGSGGRYVTDWLVLGGGGFTVRDQLPLPPLRDVHPSRERVSLGVGGFEASVVPRRRWSIRPSVGAFVGFGNLQYRLEDAQPFPSQRVVVVAPRVTFETDVSDSISLGVAASYRIIDGPSLAFDLTRDLVGPRATVFARWKGL